MPSVIQILKGKILNVVQTIKKNPSILIKIAPIFSLIIPFLILYFLYPASYEATWKGRTYYLFFMWAFFLETILSWERLQTKVYKWKSPRLIIFVFLISLPTLYVITANFWGVNDTIVNISPKSSWKELMPLSVEYLVFTVLFAAIIAITYGIKGFNSYSLSPCLLGMIGLIYTIDNLYPFGAFTPFQVFVPTTAAMAATVLNFIGYKTEWGGQVFGTPVLRVFDSNGKFLTQAGIAWPCSGVDSLIIYLVTILLFLKSSNFSWKQRITYFIFGAAVTYLINILRIVTIYLIAIEANDPIMSSPQVNQFHNYYGPLYSITWIMAYPMIIIGIQMLWKKLRSKK